MNLQKRYGEPPSSAASSSFAQRFIALGIFLVCATVSFLLFEDFDLVSLNYGSRISPQLLQINTSEAHQDRFRELFEAWETIYHLRFGDKAPNETINYYINGTKIPVAPHLLDCFKVTEKRKSLEMRPENGSLPAWAVGESINSDFRPPWIKGANEDNLPYTRYVQTKIWKLQFPADCNSPDVKFALLHWTGRVGHGLGSQLHIMSYNLGRAFTEGRTAVIHRESFDRTRTEDCKELGQYGRVECFFFQMTSPQCEEAAYKIWNGTNTDKISEFWVDPKLGFQYAFIPKEIEDKKPWAQTLSTVEELGQMMGARGEEFTRVGWWHAQAIRYIMRWPSNYMCHALNKVRQQSYGLQTARMVLEAREAQEVVVRKAEAKKPGDGELLREKENVTNLENELWWDQLPYIPRPIVSAYVRQGDKVYEMRVAAMPAYIWLLERLRKHVPNLENVWISSEIEAVINETKEYEPRWKFFYTNNSRLTEHMEEADAHSDKEDVVLSFASLIISSQCDYFVGPLASNSVRVVNELRMTGGRLRVGFIALNYNEW